MIGTYDRFQCGVNAYHAWIQDYITYDLFTDPNPDGGLPQGAVFVNTDRAIMKGLIPLENSTSRLVCRSSGR